MKSFLTTLGLATFGAAMLVLYFVYVKLYYFIMVVIGIPLIINIMCRLYTGKPVSYFVERAKNKLLIFTQKLIPNIEEEDDEIIA